MIVEQQDLFAQIHEDKLLLQSKRWWTHRGWKGPIAGQMCTIEVCLPDLEVPYIEDNDSVGPLFRDCVYATMEQCNLLEKRIDGRWLAVIKSSSKDINGVRILLDEWEMGPPRGF